MKSNAGLGGAYRLLVSVDGRCAVADDSRYKRFDQAQSRVANAILRHPRAGRIDSVLLQRGKPLEYPIRDIAPRPSTPKSLMIDDRHEWIVEKRWGPEVVKRILEQNGMPHAIATPQPSGLRARARRYISLHRNTRWHIVGTAALVTVMVLTILGIQTGGRLDWFFSPASGRIKTELPFDARVDFEPNIEQQPAAPRRTYRTAATPPVSRATGDPEVISGPQPRSVQISAPGAP